MLEGVDNTSLANDTLTLFKREMIIYKNNIRSNIGRAVIFPLIFLLIFGSLSNNFVYHIPVAVVNYANNPQSLKLISALTAQGDFTISTVTNEQQALSMLRDGSVVMTIIILPSYPNPINGHSSIQSYYSNSNFASAGSAVASLEAIVGSQSKSALEPVQLAAAPKPAQVSINIAYGIKSNYFNFLAGGIIVMVAGFGAIFGGGISIITDKGLGNLKSFLISPISKNAIVFSKILYGTTTSVISGAAAMLMAILFGAGIAMGTIGILWILVLVILVSLGFSSLTVVLASRINKIEIYQIAAQVIVLPLWILSGGLLPTSSLPNWAAAIAAYDPMTYASNGIRSVMISGYFPIGQVAVDLIALSLFTVITVIIAIILFKSKID